MYDPKILLKRTKRLLSQMRMTYSIRCSGLYEQLLFHYQRWLRSDYRQLSGWTVSRALLDYIIADYLLTEARQQLRCPRSLDTPAGGWNKALQNPDSGNLEDRAAGNPLSGRCCRVNIDRWVVHFVEKRNQTLSDCVRPIVVPHEL